MKNLGSGMTERELDKYLKENLSIQLKEEYRPINIRVYTVNLLLKDEVIASEVKGDY